MRCTPSVQPLPDTVLFIIVYWLLAHLPCTKRHRQQELRFRKRTNIVQERIKDLAINKHSGN